MTKRDELMQELVKTEASNLRRKATKDEIGNLDFYYLDSSNVTACIYGQMTGDCFSERANKLIVSCAERVYRFSSKSGKDFNTDVLEKNKINGKPTLEGRDHYFSPIEVFIHNKKNRDNGNNERLVKYLEMVKGNRETEFKKITGN